MSSAAHAATRRARGGTREERASRQARAALMRDIERDHRKKERAKLVALREQIRAARLARRNALADATSHCRAERLAVRERTRMERLRALEELRKALHAERQAARDACAVRKEKAKIATSDAIERARGEHAAEAAYQGDLKRIERGHREQRRGARGTSASERRSESDDEVRSNLAPELAALFEKVKRGIKGSARESRTEAFLRYAEEHPDEVLSAIDDKTDQVIRDLERQEREAARQFRQRKYTPAELAAVPF
jgi:uncharacterized FlaG/YvyC family protein